MTNFRKPRPEPERFWGKVDVGHPLGCWVWTAAKNPQNYGLFLQGTHTNGTGRMVAAHRWSHEYLKGPIPEGLHIDHLCRTPPLRQP